MAVHNEAITVEYEGNGETSIFPVPFAFHAAGDLVVVKTVDEVDTTLTITTHYTVTGAAEPEGAGYITLVTVPEEDEFITITRDTARTQPTDFGAAVFTPASHEKAMDRVVLICQELSARLGEHELAVAAVDERLEELPEITLATFAFWKMEALVSGSYVDDETGTYDVFNQGAFLSIAAGQVGNAGTFAGSTVLTAGGSGAVTLADIHQGVRVSLWVKATLPLAAKGLLWHARDNDRLRNDLVGGEIFGVYLMTNGRIRVQWDSSGVDPAAAQGLTTVETISSATWTEVVCTRYDDGFITIAMGGEIVETGTGTPIAWTTAAGSGEMALGGTNVAGFGSPEPRLVGSLDEVKIETVSV